MHADGDGLNGLSGQVIGCAFTVLNALGAGFLEKVYENALAHEIRAAGLKVAQQFGMKVQYREVIVGEYFADLIVEDALLVEVKAVKALDDAHRYAMHQLPQGRRPASLPAAELRQAPYGN
jgi:GxxExxY protein